MARISSSEYCRLQTGSFGEATPPEAMILIWVAPLRSSSRAARRHLRHAVGDAAERGARMAAGAARNAGGARAEIAVAAGLAQRPAGDEQPRPGDEALLHRLGEPEIGAAGVAHRGEAARQHALQDVARLVGDEGDRHARQPREIDLDRDRMDMRVDQPGHQRAAGKIDGFCIPAAKGPVLKLP